MNPSQQDIVDTDGDIVMQDYHYPSDSATEIPFDQNAQSTRVPGRAWSILSVVPANVNVPPINEPRSSPNTTSNFLLTHSQFPWFYEHPLNSRTDPFRPSQLTYEYHDQRGRQERTMQLPPPAPLVRDTSDNTNSNSLEYHNDNQNQSTRQPVQTIASRQLPYPDRNLPPLSSVFQTRADLLGGTANLRAHVAAHFASRTNSLHEAQAAARMLEQYRPLPPRGALPPPHRNAVSPLPPLPTMRNNHVGHLPRPENQLSDRHHTDDYWPVPDLGRFSDRPIAVPVSRKLKRIEKKKTVSCTACMDQFAPSELVPAPCNCKYCKECLNDLFRSGCASILSFPPSCHNKALRINVFGELLKPEVLIRYKQIEQEFSSQKPLYCALSTCSKFIEEKDIVTGGNYGICITCSNCTCTLCKMLLTCHELGEERKCPAEPKSLVALRELGELQEWRQCPSCNNMVEKIDGCDHMECPCGVEFCYRCGSFYNEWDDCDCTGDVHSDEEHDDEDDEQTMWPDHRRMMDAFGRPRCAHRDVDIVDGDMCHGCLIRTGDTDIVEIRFLRCIRCSIELCTSCHSSITNSTED
jgi:hypothetical protein